MPRLFSPLLAVSLSLLCACTPTTQVRGTATADRLLDLKELAGSQPGDPIRAEVAARSIERYKDFTLGFKQATQSFHGLVEKPLGRPNWRF